MSRNRDEAVKLLDHYITLLMERQGTRQLKVDSDTHTEIKAIVDNIIDAAAERVFEQINETKRQMHICALCKLPRIRHVPDEPIHDDADHPYVPANGG